VTNAIEVRHLHVVRGGVIVLDDLSCDVGHGTVTGLLGPSGSGKSTLIRSIVGVQIVAGGSVEVLGLPAGVPRLRDRVGYVGQSTSVYPDLTVRENVRYFSEVVGAPLRDVDRVIAQVDLVPHTRAEVKNLSSGEQARVSLASALVGSPEILILDEPTVGLDPLLRRDLWALFRRLAAEGVTLLVSSHVMDEAARCDRLLLLREGRLLADESPAGLLGRTGEPDFESAFVSLIESAVT